MPELIKIGEIPPLRQSTEECMSCQEFYVATFIKGRKQPSGVDANRGTQIHKTMASYVSHCARKGVESDVAAFDLFSRGAGPQAAKILSGLRNTLVVDHQHLFATEITLSLDEDFMPTNVCAELDGICRDSEKTPAHEGTLDTIYVFRDEYRIVVEDYKSHLKPFEPDEKPQGKKYALFVFQHFPWVQTVTFRLVFVRYPRLTREISYTRDQLPMLIDVARASRELQKTIHEDYESGKEMQAIAGAHCNYCPMLSDASCKIAEYNENMQLTMEDRASWSLWNTAFSRVNNKVLKDYVQSTGKQVVLKDYMGKAYVYGPVSKESNIYPLFKKSGDGLLRNHNGFPILPIVDLLLDHIEVNPDDTEFLTKLVISGSKLESYLKSKSRVMLHQSISDSADKVTKVTLRISKPLDAVPVEDDEDQDESDDFEDEDF